MDSKLRVVFQRPSGEVIESPSVQRVHSGSETTPHSQPAAEVLHKVEIVILISANILTNYWCNIRERMAMMGSILHFRRRLSCEKCTKMKRRTLSAKITSLWYTF